VRQFGEQLRVVIERGDPVAAPGEVDCHPAGSGTDVEDRAAVLVGE